MTLRLRSLKPLLVCGLVLGAPVARAEPSAAELSGARQAFESAVALESEHKWADATAKLRQALAVKDTPGLRFHLAHCEERQGQLVEAELDYERASSLLARGATAPDVQKLLLPASSELKRRIPQLVVEIPSEVSNPVVEVDGKACVPSELALGVALNPGAHQLKVSASGLSPFEHAFSLKEGERVSIRAELKASPAPTPAAVTPGATNGLRSDVNASAAPSVSRGTSPKLYLLLGESAVTVAGLAIGVGYALAESSARDRAQSAQAQVDLGAQGDSGACNTSDPTLTGPCSVLRSAITEHDRDATVSTVGFVCAGIGAAALVTTWLAYPNRASESTGAFAQPVIALGRIGLQGRF